MKYWSNQGPTVHILDGSKNPINKNKLDNFGKNIIYHHWQTTFVERISKVCELLDTEYTVLLGDDEFLLKKGIEKILKELKSDEELVSCMGITMLFSVKKDKIRAWPFYNNMLRHQITQKTAEERIEYHLANYIPSTMYSIVRTEIWKKSWSSSIEREFSIHGQFEIQFETSVCFYGKSKTISELYWLRSGENNTIKCDDKSLDIKNIPFHKWILNKKYKNEQKDLFEIMTMKLKNKRDNLFRDKLIKYHMLYGDKENKSKKSVYYYYKKLITNLINICPEYYKVLINKFIIPFNKKPSIDKVLDFYDNENINYNINEVNHLKKIILDFHSKEQRFN